MGFSDVMTPGLAFGAGLAFGSNKKFVITTGSHWSFVKRLSNAYQGNPELSQPPSSYTVSALNNGWFLSIGYNFINF